MSKRAITAFALPAMLLVLLLLPLTAGAQTAGDPSATSSLLVKLISGLSVDEQAAAIARNGGVETSSIPALRLHVVAVSIMRCSDSSASCGRPSDGSETIRNNSQLSARIARRSRPVSSATVGLWDPRPDPRGYGHCGHG